MLNHDSAGACSSANCYDHGLTYYSRCKDEKLCSCERAISRVVCHLVPKMQVLYCLSLLRMWLAWGYDREFHQDEISVLLPGGAVREEEPGKACPLFIRWHDVILPRDKLVSTVYGPWSSRPAVSMLLISTGSS